MRNEYAPLPDELRLRFEVTEDDMIRLGRSLFRTRLRASSWAIGGSIAALALFFGLALLAHRPEILTFAASIATSFSVLYAFRAGKSRARLMRSTLEDLSPSPARTVDIDAEGLRYAAEDRNAQIPWESIVSVRRGREQIDLVRTDTDGYVLPRRAFDTGTDFETASIAIDRYVRAARTRPVSIEPETESLDLSRPSITFRYSVYDLQEMAGNLRALGTSSRRDRFIGTATYAVLTVAMFVLLDWKRLHSGKDAAMLITSAMGVAMPDWLTNFRTEEARRLLGRPGMKSPHTVTASPDGLVHRVGGATLTYRWSAVRSFTSDETGIYITVPGSIIAIPFTAFHYRRQMARYVEALREFHAGAGSAAAA